MIRALGRLLALVALALPAAAIAQVAPPRLTVRTLDQLPRPLAAPYDAEADARADIAAASARARKSGKRLLIDFGANWCVDCRVFASVVELPEMRAWVARHFELVTVDVGRFNRNLDLAARYGVSLDAVPAIFVIDPHQESIAISEARKLGVPVVAITDTNCDPDLVDFVIPGNDDAIRSIKLITSRVADACVEGAQRRKDHNEDRGGERQERGDRPEGGRGDRPQGPRPDVYQGGRGRGGAPRPS